MEGEGDICFIDKVNVGAFHTRESRCANPILPETTKVKTESDVGTNGPFVKSAYTRYLHSYTLWILY